MRRAVVLIALSVATCMASVLSVPAQYPTIQAGLNAAQAGDTVLVASGTYIENIVWPCTGSIRLIADSGPESTIIDGNHAASVIRIETVQDSTAVISGFSISNGEAPYGGGILLAAGSCPRISGNIIFDNRSTGAPGGGGIYAKVSNESYLIIEGNLVCDNHAFFSGGGICIELEPYPEPSTVVIYNNDIFENTAGQGGGLYLYNGSEPFQLGAVLLLDCSIISNRGVIEGGGLSLFGPITVDHCILEGDSAHIGAAISNLMGGCTITSCQITGNVVYPDDPECGAITIWEDLSQGMQPCLIESCAVTSNIGNGIAYVDYLATYPLLDIHYCSISDNTGYGILGSLTDATYCWWGDPSGPGGAGPGSGDEVSEDVIYDPWLTEMGTGTHDPCVLQCVSLSPNPFSTITQISYELLDTARVLISVFDCSGRLVQTLVDGEMGAGEHSTELDGSELAAGVYLMRLTTPGSCTVARCICLR